MFFKIILGLLILMVVGSMIRRIRMFFTGGYREADLSSASHRRTSAASSSAKRKKIIPEEEGEYVEYEEVKE